MISKSLRLSEDNFCCYRPITTNQVRVIWEITNKCNLKCRHCFVNQKINVELLTTKKAIEVVEDFVNFPVAKIMFTGGEPFIRQDLFKIVEKIKQINSNIIIDITTNCTLLDDNKIFRLKKLGVDEVTTSLDGDRQTHDLIRRKEGNFKKVLETVNKLLTKDIKVDVVTVVNKLNYKKIAKVIDITYNEGFSSITISDMISRKDSRIKCQDILLAEEEKTKVYDLIMSKRNQYGKKFPIRTVALTSRLSSQKCRIKNIVSIDFNGNIYHCLLTSDISSKIYNVRKNKLSEVYEKLNVVKCQLK